MNSIKFLNIFFILIIIFNCCKIPAAFPQNRFILKGYIQNNSDFKKVPEFRILFNGEQVLNDENGFYSFSVDKKIQKLDFIVCKDIKQNFKKINTIKNLSVHFDKDYKYFSFTKTGTDNIWEKKEKFLDDNNFVLPKDCLIVLMNPKFVQDVISWNIKLDNNFLNLPKVVLNKDITEKKLKRASVKSILYSLDKIVFHRNIETSNKVFSNNIKASITQ